MMRCLATCTLALLWVASARDGRWEGQTSLPSNTVDGRLWMGAVYSSTQQRIYAFGGTTSSDFFSSRAPLDDFYEVDVTDQNAAAVTWSSLSPSGKPSARAGIGMATDGDYIWIHGGLGLGTDYYNDMYVYDIAGNSFTTLTSGAQITAFHHFVYCPCSGTPTIYSYAGAYFDSGAGYDLDRRDFYSYNIAGDSWTTISGSADPGFRSFGGVVYLQSQGVDYLFVVMGMTMQTWPFTFYDDVWAYNIGTSTWQERGKGKFKPAARWGHGTSVIPYADEDQIAIFGGQDYWGTSGSDPHTYRNDIWVYSALYDAWTNIIPVDASGNDAPDEAPTVRYGMAMPRMEYDGDPLDQIFILCGGDASSMKTDSGSERMVFRFGIPIPTTTTSVTITSTSATVSTSTSTSTTSATMSSTVSSTSSGTSTSSTSISSTSSGTTSSTASSSSTWSTTETATGTSTTSSSSSTSSFTNTSSTTESQTTSMTSTKTTSTSSSHTTSSTATTKTETTTSVTSSISVTSTVTSTSKTSSISVTSTSETSTSSTMSGTTSTATTATVTTSTATSLTDTTLTTSSSTATVTTATTTTATTTTATTTTISTSTPFTTTTLTTSTETATTVTVTTQTVTTQTVTTQTVTTQTVTTVTSSTATVWTNTETTTQMGESTIYLGILAGGIAVDASFQTRWPCFVLFLCASKCLFG